MSTTYYPPDKSTVWKGVAVCAVIIAVAAGLWDYQQVRKVGQLTVNLQTSRDQSRAQIQATMNNLKILQTQLDTSQSDLKNSLAQFQAASHPDLPGTLDSSKAFLGPGLIGIIQKSTNTIKIAIAVAAAVLSAQQEREIGHLNEDLQTSRNKLQETMDHLKMLQAQLAISQSDLKNSLQCANNNNRC